MDSLSVPWVKSKAAELATYVMPRADTYLPGAMIPTATSRGLWDPEPTVRQLYERLAALKITYAREPFHYDNQKEQVIRPAYEVLDGLKGGCLDLALTFAGLCLSLDLIPVIIVFKTHAIAAVSKSRAWSDHHKDRPEVVGYGVGEVLRDQQKLKNYLGEYLLPVECTGFTWNVEVNDQIIEPVATRLSFDEAVKEGERRVGGPGFMFAVDVGLAFEEWGYEARAVDEGRIGKSLRLRTRARDVLERVNSLIDEHASNPLVGRGFEMEQLDRLVDESHGGRAFVTAKAGFGKTALLCHWIRRRQAAGTNVVYHLFSRDRGADLTVSVDDLYVSLIEQIRAITGDVGAELDAPLDSVLKGALRRYDGGASSPLAVVIDGLDEAAREFYPPFPDDLPEGVMVVASARNDPRSINPNPLAAEWQRNAQELSLTRLSSTAVKELLELDPSPAVRRLAEDDELLVRLEAVAQGFPLYLRYVIEDIRQAAEYGRSPLAVLQGTPVRFSDYIRLQFNLLAEEDLDGAVINLFALLTVTLGPLEVEAISEITGLDEFKLPKLPRSVARWFIVDKLARDQSDLYSFAHPLLAHEYRLILRTKTPAAAEALVAYCLRAWRTGSAYSIRYLVRHLAEGSRWSEAQELALSAEFRRAQARLAEGEALVRSTLRYGLTAAQKRSDLGAMVETALRLGYLKARIRERPVAACRRGAFDSVEELLDSYDKDAAFLLTMLVAYHLSRQGETEMARRIGRRLLPQNPGGPQNPPRPSPDYAELFLFLLPEFGALFTDRFRALAEQLLGPEDRQRMANLIIAERSPAEANELLSLISESLPDVDSARAALSRRAAREGDSGLAADVSAAIKDAGARKEALATVIEIYADRGMPEEMAAAYSSYSSDISLGVLLFTLPKVVSALLKVGEVEAVRRWLRVLREQVLPHADADVRWYVESFIWEFERESNPENISGITPDKIAESIREIGEPDARMAAYMRHASLMKKAGDVDRAAAAFEKAFEDVGQIKEARVVAGAHLLAACDLFAMGRLDAAREQFTLAEEAAAAQADDAVNNLLEIAATRFECGDAEGAEATFARAQAEGEKKLSETGQLGSIFQLVTLAKVRSKVGMKEQALAKLSEAVAIVDRIAESSTRSILESYFYEKFLAAIARGYAAVGALQEATNIVGRMSDKAELLQAVGYVASALRDAGREAEAVDLIEAALTKRADPGPELVSLTAELLKTLADKATAGGQSAVAGAALLGAEDLLRKSGQKTSRIKSLWEIHLWQAFLGQREAAGRGFDRLQQEVQAIPEAAQGTLYREMMETFLEQPRDASGSIIFVDTFESHINNPELRRFWSVTIRDLCRELGPRPDEFEDNFREAQELLQSGLELYRASNYTEMAVVYWRGDRGSGQLRESIRALLTMALDTVFADAKRTPEYGLDWVRLSNVLMTAGWVGEYEWAAQTGLVAEVETLHLGDWILFDHAEFNRRQGQFAAATNLAQAIKRGRLSAYALSMIVQAEAEAGADPAQATGLEPLRQLVRNTSDPKERASCLVALAAALARVGLVDDGIQALEDAADELAEVVVWDREDPLKIE